MIKFLAAEMVGLLQVLRRGTKGDLMHVSIANQMFIDTATVIAIFCVSQLSRRFVSKCRAGVSAPEILLGFEDSRTPVYWIEQSERPNLPGEPGSGRTASLLCAIERDARKEPEFVFYDPHGEDGLRKMT